MSEREELRRRIGALLEVMYPPEVTSPFVSGEQVAEMFREDADAVLAEICETHVLVPRRLIDALTGDYDCGDAVGRATYGLDVCP